MRLFVSALEYSANIHLKYLLREMIKSENIELCGIFDESVIGNLSLELHSAEKSKSKKPNKSFCYFWLIPKVESPLPLNSNFISGKSLCDISQVAVMGFIDVIKRARFFLELRKKCVNLALSADKILLMDSSSFNIPIAKRVKKRDSRKMIMYYILPQVWAWKPWRAKVIEANCDKLAAILPFEVGCYRQKAKFVGHPLLDEIKAFRSGNSSLELHSIDLANFGRSQTISLVSRPKFAKNYESQTENPSVVLNDKNGEFANQVQNYNNYRHTEHSEVSKSRDYNKNNESMTKERIGESNRFAQSRQIVGDSRIAKMDSSLCTSCYAQNDESCVDCHESLRNSRNDKSTKIFTFMPGSRLSEINRIFPIFLQVKDELKKRDSKAQFNLVVPKKFEIKNLNKIYGNTSDFHITFDAHTSLLQSTFAFICSGTATLECALIGTPFVLGYQGRWIEAFVVKQFLNIRFVGLANLLYSHIAPNSQFHIELLQENLNAKNLLDSYHNANPNDFLAKSLALRAYLKNGSARAVAQWLLEK